MPRKTKEPNENEIQNKKSNAKKASTKKVASKKTEVAPKSTTTKDTTAKKATSKKTATSKKAATSKTTTNKKAATSKSTTKKSTSKKTTAKKSTTSKKTTNKSTRKTTKKDNKKIEIVEYYDLPYRYNQTVVKVLYQTPKTLFIYWDISDKDRKQFEEQYGEHFFSETKPILVIHNETLRYSFEIEINDFANSWYLHVADAKCEYKIELGRRPIIKNEKINTDYIYVATSNEIEAPNDRILFNKEQKMVYFRNIKTGSQTGKTINTISFMRNMGKIYNIYDLYKAIYNDENIEELYDLSNPSSGNPSSGSLSSKFK